MSSALRIPVFDTDYEPRFERGISRRETVRAPARAPARRREHEYPEERHEHHDHHEHHEHHTNMAEVMGTVVVGAIGLGILGGMMRR